MDKALEKLAEVGLSTFAVLTVASVSPNFSAAQEATSPFAEWLEVYSAAGAGWQYTDNCHSIGLEDNVTRPVKVGVSYRFTEDHAGFLERTADLIRNPSETIARRELFAVDITQLSTEDWKVIADQAASTSKDTRRLSVIMTTEHGYVGTPIKWDQGATEAIAAALATSAESGFEQNEFAVAYASGLMAGSLGSFGMMQNSVVSDVRRVALAAKKSCGSLHDTEGNGVGANVYVGFSFEPNIENVAIRALTTDSGVGGERLGSEVPSWPYAEKSNR